MERMQPCTAFIIITISARPGKEGVCSISVESLPVIPQLQLVLPAAEAQLHTVVRLECHPLWLALRLHTT